VIDMGSDAGGERLKAQEILMAETSVANLDEASRSGARLRRAYAVVRD